MSHLPISRRPVSRRVTVAAVGVCAAATVGSLVGAPTPAGAEYQHLPATSPATWSYNGTLATMTKAADTAADAADTAAAFAASSKSAYQSAQRALADAKAKERAAVTTQTKAKSAYDNAQGSTAKAQAKASYERATTARNAATKDVASKRAREEQAYFTARQAGIDSSKAATAATFAQTKLGRLKSMYGSSPTTAFTKPRATYTFSGNGRRPSSSQWKIYNTTKTDNPTARDPRYVGVYNNNLEVTSWGTIGSGACLCAGTALPTTPYGRWEVRAKVNRNADHGVAVLLWPNERLGPQSGEIDLAEFNNSRTQANFALHYDEDNLQTQAHILGDFRTWHTYRVDWNARGIAWYIDNNLFAIVTDKAQIPTKPFRLAIQAGPNSSKSKKTSTTITVSSIKVFAP